MQKTNCRKINRQNILKTVFIILGVVLVLFLGILFLQDNAVVMNSREKEESFVVEKITGEQRHGTGSPTGIVVEYMFPITNDSMRDRDLMFYVSHHWVDVRIGEELVYTLGPSEELEFIKTPGSKWVCIPLLLEDEGKNVHIVMTPVYEDNVKNELEIYLGSSMAIYRNQLHQMLPVISLCVANILAGFALIFGTIYFKKKNQRGIDIFAPGMLGISVGFWQLAHNDFSPFLLEGKEIFLYYLSVTMMMICMIPLICSAAKNLFYYLVGMAVMAVIQIVLQVDGIWDLREMFLFTHGGIIAGALLLIGSMIIDIVKKRDRSEKNKYAWILGIGVLGDLILYYLKDSSSGLMMILSAILIYMLLEAFEFMSAYFEQQTLLEEQEIQLTHSRMMVLMSQIRSHFVFNILNAISGMCKYDPEKADETICSV